jgi:dTDP-4-amino-4,6-dideoxygalactose transaminase
MKTTTQVMTSVAPAPAAAPPAAVPFFRPDIREAEVQAVVETLRSGWLTTGPRVAQFEREFALAVGADRAIAVNSCTAALHLAVEALGLTAGSGVLVPTMTFAATAEIVRYMGAVPILVDCDPETGNIDLEDARRILTGERRCQPAPEGAIVGIIPVHVGGLMIDCDAIQRFAAEHSLWVVEDAAHAMPAAWRASEEQPWRHCGSGTADVTCFSFYANKTLTTGEGGMAVTNDPALADRMRLMSLHGLSHDAWGRYREGGSWDYRIVAAGFKDNMTDVAAAIGIEQLARAETMRTRREDIAHLYTEGLAGEDALELPPGGGPNRIHSWHLFPIRLNLDRLTIDRNQFIEELKLRGVMTSVHWRPLHLHPYYRDTFGFAPGDFPRATAMFARNLSLPLFPTMSDREIEQVIAAVRDISSGFRR